MTMTSEAARAVIDRALDTVKSGASAEIDETTDLVADGVLDSLDIMAFLFEVEKLHGRRLAQIDETYSDFRVSSLVRILQSEAT